MKKSNLESVLERQINQHITNFGNKNYQEIIGISYVNNCPNYSTPNPDKNQPKNSDLQPTKNQAKIEKLKNLGLSKEEIAEILDIPLDVIDRVDVEELD